MQNYYLAQVNIARMKAPLDDPMMAEFKAAMDEMNAIADSSEGFVWRLQDETDDAETRAYDDPKILVNMSVWQSAPQLKAYVYGSLHNDFFVRRRQWFEPLSGAHFGMWWTPAGQFPTAMQGKAKINHLTLNGESPECFTFKAVYPVPIVRDLAVS